MPDFIDENPKTVYIITGTNKKKVVVPTGGCDFCIYAWKGGGGGRIMQGGGDIFSTLLIQYLQSPPTIILNGSAINDYCLFFGNFILVY